MLMWSVCILFMVMGIIAFVIGLRLPAEKHDVAVALETRGAWCVGIGLAIAGVYWVYRRLVDY